MTEAQPVVRYERDGDVAILTIANPLLNLYGGGVASGIMSGINRAEAEGARAVLLRAEGKYFSAGVDVRGFEAPPAAPASSGSGSASAARSAGLLSHRLEDLPIPTIASVHALCLTAAFELVLGCDLIIAAESAKFGLSETTIGLTPLAGGTQRIAFRAGIARAYEMVLSGDRFDAATLERWNVINWVVPDDELEETALRIARRYANVGDLERRHSRWRSHSGTPRGSRPRTRARPPLRQPRLPPQPSRSRRRAHA